MSYEQKINKTRDTSTGFKYNAPNGNVEYKKETVEEIKKLPICENKERGISKETMEAYGVRCAFSEETGKVVAYYFPSYNKKGELTGYSKQDLTKDKKEKFHWSTVGVVDIENKLFGQHFTETIQNKNRVLIITEGQWDCLSAYQARKYCLDKGQYTSLKPFVVSIPMGTLNAKKSVLINKKYITSFNELLIHFDNDTVTDEEAKKGIKRGLEATQDVLSVLSGESIRLKTFTHDERFKDASDYLQAGVKNGKLNESMEYLDSKYWKANDAEAEKIVKLSDFDLDQLLKPLNKGISLVDFPKLDEMLFGLRPKECTVLTAGSGVGKSTIASKIGETAKKQGKRIGNIYLEESADKTMQRYLASELGVGFKEFRRNPLDCGYTRGEIEEVFRKLVKKDDVIMLDHFGSMPISELMSKIKYMHVVENCDLIIVDHLSMVISGSDVKDERKELDMVMTQIASFCESHDVHVILIVHINRKNGEGQTVPKDKDGNEKPYWIRINLTSLRGSAGIEQLASNVIAIESEQLPDRKRGRVRFAVLKNREGGELGEADYFKINPITWEVMLCDEDDKGSDINVNMIKDTPTVIDKSKFTEKELDDLPY
jgi:KaiC/GvpD/RAD55 family RecA-like ATPase